MVMLNQSSMDEVSGDQSSATCSAYSSARDVTTAGANSEAAYQQPGTVSFD